MVIWSCYNLSAENRRILNGTEFKKGKSSSKKKGNQKTIRIEDEINFLFVLRYLF